MFRLSCRATSKVAHLREAPHLRQWAGVKSAWPVRKLLVAVPSVALGQSYVGRKHVQVAPGQLHGFASAEYALSRV